LKQIRKANHKVHQESTIETNTKDETRSSRVPKSYQITTKTGKKKTYFYLHAVTPS